MAGALGEKALDFFDSEANVVPEFEGRQVAEARLFPDPRFWNAQKFRELRRTQKRTAGVSGAPVRDPLT